MNQNKVVTNGNETNEDDLALFKWYDSDYESYGSTSGKPHRSLANIKEWGEASIKEIETKTYILYHLPIDQLEDYMSNTAINNLPLGDFVENQLEREKSLRERLIEFIPFVRNFNPPLFIYEYFDDIFEPEFEEHIDFEFRMFYLAKDATHD